MLLLQGCDPNHSVHLASLEARIPIRAGARLDQSPQNVCTYKAEEGGNTVTYCEREDAPALSPSPPLPWSSRHSYALLLRKLPLAHQISLPGGDLGFSHSGYKSRPTKAPPRPLRHQGPPACANPVCLAFHILCFQYRPQHAHLLCPNYFSGLSLENFWASSLPFHFLWHHTCHSPPRLLLTL